MSFNESLQVEFEVSASFAVEFLDLEDEVGRGIKTVRGRVAGRLRAIDGAEADEILRQSIRNRFPVCWAMQVGKVHISRV